MRRGMTMGSSASLPEAGLPEDGRGAMRESVVTVGSAQLRDQARRAVVTESEASFGCHSGLLAHIADYEFL